MADKRNRSQKKKWTWKGWVLYILFLLVFVLVVGEVIVRIMGAAPWSPDHYTFEVDPGDSFFEPDETLGFKGRAGDFQLTLSDTLQISVSHDSEGYRITQKGPVDAEKPSIWIFGCSFTHGYGVEDHENYPWMLQEDFPDFTVYNFGMDGYGTYHSLLQLQDQLKQKKAPELVILAYGGFHDQRNVNNRYWKKALAGRDIAEGITYPYLRFNESGELISGMEKPAYNPWPLMRYSALTHYLEKAYNRFENEELKPFEVTLEIIRRIDSVSRGAGADLVVANIFRHEESQLMLDQLPEMNTVDISVDLDDLSLRILPNDGHPNMTGHRMMADSLISYLRLQDLVPVANPPVDSLLDSP